MAAVLRIEHDAQVEDLGAGIYRQWLYDGRIVSFTLTKTTREAIDIWFDGVKDALLHWPADKTYLAIHELVGSEVSLTPPYVRSRAVMLQNILRS